MASEAVFAEPRVRAKAWIAEAAFVGFLLLVFVGLTPFASRDMLVQRMAEGGATGAGDALRQVSFVAVFSVIALSAFRKFGAQMIALVPLALSLMLVWCLLSSSWAAEGGVTIRRAGLEVVIVLSAIWGVETIGIERALVLLRGVLIGVLIVDWVSIPLTVRAVHNFGEADPSLVGAWRGLYFHKNIAGAVSAVSALVFLFFALDQKRRIDWAFFAAALLFTIMTKSKSSMGLLVPALVGWGLFRMLSRNGLDRSIAVVAGLCVTAAVLTIVFSDWTAIVAFFSDPQEFTGRTAVWQAEIAFIADHTFLGSGFGSFADTGAISPLHGYVDGAWIEALAHGHNGYLQLLVETGVIGFGLAILALVIQPAIAFFRRDAIPRPFRAFLFSLFVFLVLHNLLESDFFQSDGPAWVTFLIMLAMLRQAGAIAGHEVQVAP